MSISRRSFVGRVSAGGIGALSIPWVSARGMEALTGSGQPSVTTHDGNGAIRLSSNENPHGPAAEAIDTIIRTLSDANRYPEAYQAQLSTAIADHFGVSTDNIVLGCGSGELLRMAVEAYTSPTRALVTAAPTFEIPERTAATLGREVRSIPVGKALALDLNAMAQAAQGAGLVFLCNPNNPTGTAHPLGAVRDFVSRVHQASSDTMIVIDEAYFDFCDLNGYGTMIPDALVDPRLIVTRTFSKIYGLAGLRAGYLIAHPQTAARLTPYRLGAGVGVLACAAAQVSLGLKDHAPAQVALNREARAFTRQAFEKIGYPTIPSYTNFVMLDVRRDAAEFQRVCAANGVMIGRVFPPLLSHARVSIGTMDEMQRAMDVIGPILRGP